MRNKAKMAEIGGLAQCQKNILNSITCSSRYYWRRYSTQFHDSPTVMLIIGENSYNIHSHGKAKLIDSFKLSFMNVTVILHLRKDDANRGRRRSLRQITRIVNPLRLYNKRYLHLKLLRHHIRIFIKYLNYHSSTCIQ